MNRTTTLTLLLALWAQALLAGTGSEFPVDQSRRTLDQKIKDAQLIVLGIATSRPAGDGTSMRIDIKDVLWPPSLTNRSRIVFRTEVWAPLSNQSAIFFLTRNRYPERGAWDRLYGFDDWVEPLTNTLAVLFALEKLKGEPGPAVLQPPKFRYPNTTRYDASVKLRLAYLGSFRDGYYDAVLDKHGLTIFNPATEEDKAKVMGYADGQLCGDAARVDWIRKLTILMR